MKVKKGDKNKGDKLLQKLLASDSFEEDLQKARAELGIPVGGYSSDEEILSWFSKNRDTVDHVGLVIGLLKKQKLPKNSWWMKRMIEMVFSNGNSAFLPRTLFPDDPFVEIAGRGSVPSGGYTDIRIYSGASSPEVCRFIKENWDFVKPAYRVGTSKRIRGSDFDERNKYVLKYMQMEKEELLKSFPYPHAKVSKAVLTSHILKKEYGYEVSPENVLQVFYRMRKARR